jgi:hypothetical protein
LHFSLSDSICFKSIVEIAITSRELPNKTPILFNLAEIIGVEKDKKDLEKLPLPAESRFTVALRRIVLANESSSKTAAPSGVVE